MEEKINVKGIFDDVGSPNQPTGKESPFSGYFDDVSSNAVDTGFNRQIPETTYSKVKRQTAVAEEATAKAEKEGSLKTLALRTVNPINLAKGAFDIAKTVITKPKQSAYQAAMGLSNGLTLGATGYLERKAFINEAEKYGMDEQTAESMAAKILQPDDSTLSAIRGGANFAGIVAPYTAAEKLMVQGLRFAAPGFVTQYGTAAKLLADIGVFNAAGQIEETFKPADERDRKSRALIDTGAALAFFAGGAAFRRITNTQFTNPFTVQPVVNPGSLVRSGEVVTADSLRAGAKEQIDAISSRAFRRSGDKERLAFLKKNIDNPDELYKYNSKLTLDKNIPVQDATSAITIEVGDDVVKAGKEAADDLARAGKGKVDDATKKVTVATNNLNALRSYIKGSNNIEYKLYKEGLGVDAAGNKILARHEFNPKTGQHTIYSTNSATASTLAHELGHYFDKELTKKVSGLSRLLPDYTKNQEAIEYALSGYAVKNLGGQATPKQITAEIKRIADALIKETEALSAVRGSGKAAATPSERFADAVSVVLTKSETQKNAPVLTSLIKEMQGTDGAALFGSKLSKKIEKQAVDTAKKEVVTKEVGEKVVTKETGEKVTKKLDRTPTGKQPKTAPIRAEKITLDEETEVFLNTKVLTKLTGKERIGKSNQDILERSLSSKMTEADFNKILNERFGNLSEDVVKSKRIINDRVQSLRDKMIGKNVDELSPAELKDVTMEYEKLIETVEVFAGMRTELSNAFRSLGIEVAPGENDVLRQVFTKMQSVLGKEGDNFGFLQKALKLRENDIVDKYFTIWYPAILSGPKTTIRNIVGTGTNVATETISQLFTKQGRYTLEDRILAMVGSHKEAWNDAAAILRGDQKILSKFHEGPPLRRPDFKGPFAFLNKVEYVGRFLDAQDAYFSTISKEGEIAAMRAGNYTYGLTDKAAIDSINEAVGKAFGQRSTYRNQFDKTIFGGIGRHVTALKNDEIAAIKFASNFVIPFVRTVANVTDRKIDYIPFLNMFRVWKGKATPFIQRRAQRIVHDAGLTGREAERVGDIVAERLWQQQMGKMYMGMSVMSTVLPLAMGGFITGAGPKDKKERDTLMLKGWRPQSIILPGGVVLPYQNLGPLSGVLSFAGNIADGVRYGDADEESVTSMIGEGMVNFMRGEIDQSYLAGFSDVYDMISPYSYRPVSDIIGEFALNGIPVPAIWTQLKDIITPERYEAREFDEKVLNKIGITGSLEPKLDAFGRQMKADLIWGLTPKFINTDDKVLNWMDENNTFVGKPNRKQTIRDKRTGESREMTPEEYTKFLEATGQKIYTELERGITSGAFNRYEGDEEQLKKKVDKIVTEIRQREKSKIKY